MPQMRAVMSGTSAIGRPRKSASKNRGASKMRSCTSSTRPSRRWMVSAPSPSTRAMAATRMVRVLGWAGVVRPVTSSGG